MKNPKTEILKLRVTAAEKADYQSRFRQSIMRGSKATSLSDWVRLKLKRGY